MFALGTKILGFVTGGALKGVTSELRGAYSDKLKAETSEQKFAADITINQLEARQAALISGKGAWVSKAVQAAWATPFIIYDAKLIVWDKVLGLGATDPLSDDLMTIQMIIVSFYFLSVGIKGLRN